MKTEQLIEMLAAGNAGAADRGSATRRFVLAITLGSALVIGAMLLVLGVRLDIAAASRLPMFWVKLGFPAAVAATAAYAVWRLAHPGGKSKNAAGILAALVAGIWLLAAVSLAAAPAAQRGELVMGDTWLFCMAAIFVLSLPMFGAAVWALRSLAPTRLSLAGAAAGLLAGATAATVYALHCPELSAAFIALWYVAGICLPCALGALLGGRLLRW